jgi:hypothetical protein
MVHDIFEIKDSKFSYKGERPCSIRFSQDIGEGKPEKIDTMHTARRFCGHSFENCYYLLWGQASCLPYAWGGQDAHPTTLDNLFLENPWKVSPSLAIN